MDKAVEFLQLKNEKGIEITFSNYGATITSLKLPVSEGEKVDIVLGFDKVEDYIESFTIDGKPFLGAVVGPHSGRVRLGRYIHKGKEVQLEQNMGMDHLHGGSVNLSNQFWQVDDIKEDRIVFKISQNDNKTHFTTEYQLTEDTLNVTIKAETEEDILINLTQHSYFNLNGHNGDVTDLKVKLNAEHYLETDENLIVTGNVIPTKNSEFDYSEFKNCPKAIDTSFVINENQPNAILKSESNGLSMEVRTNQPTLHIYVGGKSGNILGKDGVEYHTQSGICFEAQNYPDSPNHENFKNGVISAGESFINETSFKFNF